MHKVLYDNAYSSWNEALPLGNGNYGAMVFYEDNRLTMAMNHYEVYYKKLAMYSNKFKNGSWPDYHKVFGKTFEEVERSGMEKYCEPDEKPFRPYQDSTGQNPSTPPYGRTPGAGVTHYPTGEIAVLPAGGMEKPDSFSLELDVEDAKVYFKAEKGDRKLKVTNLIAQGRDCMVTKISQTQAGLAQTIQMYVPSRRGQDMKVEYRALDDTTFYYIGSFYPGGEDREKYGPFRFVVMMKIVGAKGRADISPEGLDISLYASGPEITLITTVVTGEETGNLQAAAQERLEHALSHIDGICSSHENWWREFWDKSSVTLPDKMVEDLWHVNLYALACSSGKGGRMYHQACGLNGLWDIKQPTRWGSMWYWDVNIQAAFSPVYTANHLEIAEVFNDAFLSYTDRAEKMAREYHGLEGYSADFPFAIYLSIWPWCAQYLWWYYRYSMDKSFLEEKAYPLFKNVLRFFEGYMKFDEEKGHYSIYPDVSPEQGPLTRNSTSTVSAVKNLLMISIEASRILGIGGEERRKWEELLDKMPPYPIVKSNNYGEIIKDSEWAPAELHLRHPSLLMPIYPMSEINRYSGDGIRKVAENTLRYAVENTEIGVFQFGWLSRAAARLGKGNTALRMIYEKGIDLLLRTNGLFSEETERWINFCNVTTPAIYHPHMMEASGEMVSAVNEMLLQSFNGFLDIFPAVPSEDPENELAVGKDRYEVQKRMEKYKKWDSCGFRGLLAEGAFEVSAERISGTVQWVRIKSLAGSRVKLRNPFKSGKLDIKCMKGQLEEDIEYIFEDGFISFETSREGEYFLCPLPCGGSGEVPCAGNLQETDEVEAYPRVREAHTHRRIYLGKDTDTPYIKMLDKFTFDYYSGNYRESPTSIYRLDFGTSREVLPKDYRNILPPQVHLGGNMGQDFIRVSPEKVFSPYNGWGWEDAENISYVDRGGPDEFRRDFITGSDAKAFYIELPKGRYDILFLTGDNEAPSYTALHVEGQGGWKPEGVLAAGEFAAEILPVVQRKDGYLKIEFSSLPHCRWTINMMIINKYYTFL